MNWPMSQEFNEAIQNPAQVFSDPDLKLGETIVGARGLPLPRSGNFADVYQVDGADGRDWAVKCFTRPVVGLSERYARVGEALAKASLPFTVNFSFLAEGIWVGGAWRPIVKMEWVEGLLLSQVVREKANQPATLAALGQMWAKMCKRLRECGIAHTDLQHGNVLLVPGSRPGAYGLKLIDYDGMYVPALANSPSGESGHASYQHPTRAPGRIYSADLDRFPSLVIATAFKSLEVVGPALWEKYDTGDNLLFIEDDFKSPKSSKLMRELWQTGHVAVQAMVGRLAIACGKPIPQTPWLDQFAPNGEPAPLDNEARREAAEVLGLAIPVAVATSPEPVKAAAPSPEPGQSFDFTSDVQPDPAGDEGKKSVQVKTSTKTKKPRRATEEEPKSSSRLILLAGGLVVLLVGAGVAVALFSGGKKPPPDITQVEETKNPGPKEASGKSTKTGGAKGKETDSAKGAEATSVPPKIESPTGGTASADRLPLNLSFTNKTDREVSIWMITGTQPFNAKLPAGRTTGFPAPAAPGFQPLVEIIQTDGGKLSFPVAEGGSYNLVEQDGKLVITNQIKVWFTNKTDREVSISLINGVAPFDSKVPAIKTACWYETPAIAGFPLLVKIIQTDGEKLSFPVADRGSYNLVEHDGKLVVTNQIKVWFTNKTDREVSISLINGVAPFDSKVPAVKTACSYETPAIAGFPLVVKIIQTDGEKLSFTIVDGGRYDLVEQNGKIVNAYASPKPPSSSTNSQFTFHENKSVTYTGQTVSHVHFREDGRHLIALNVANGTLFTCDTMPSGPALDIRATEIRKFQPNPLLPEMHMLPKDQVALWNPRDASVVIIDNAARHINILAALEVPAGARTKYADFNVSADHRYIAAGFRHTQFRLLDTKTGKTPLKFDWVLGSIHFAADSSRVLIVEDSGTGRWFKLPSGEPDGEWKYESPDNRGSKLFRVEQASLVHGLLLCVSVPPGGGPAIPFILDANTGRTKVALGRNQAVRARLSSDGKFAVALEPSSMDKPGALAVYDVATGTEMGRTATPRNTSNFELDLSPQDNAVVIVEKTEAGSRMIPYDLQRPDAEVKTPKPELYEKTNILGFANNREFQDMAPEGGLLVGFEIGFGKFNNIDMVRSLRPIYRVGEKESKGEQHGTQLNNLVILKAKEGYAVGAISAMHGLGFDGMSITFMKVMDGKLDPNDSYESKYVGSSETEPLTKLGGSGTPVVGIIGKKNNKDMTGMGLLLKNVTPSAPTPGKLQASDDKNAEELGNARNKFDLEMKNLRADIQDDFKKRRKKLGDNPKPNAASIEKLKDEEKVFEMYGILGTATTLSLRMRAYDQQKSIEAAYLKAQKAYVTGKKEALARAVDLEWKKLQTNGLITSVDRQDPWIPLFNGKDLTGWEVHGGKPSLWKVVDGAIQGECLASGTWLRTSDKGFDDFHFRTEVMCVTKTRCVFNFRLLDGLNATNYAVSLYGSHVLDRSHVTGSLEKNWWTGGKGENRILQEAKGASPPEKEWFTLEIVARGNSLTTIVNGEKKVEVIDEDNVFARGTFNLSVFDTGGIVKMRKPEVLPLLPLPAK